VCRCPWHGACFSASTGDIEDFPGLDSLAQHQVARGHTLPSILPQVDTVEGQVVVRADKRDLLRGRRGHAIQQVAVEAELPPVVVVGGGAAGHTAVETLRREGWRGPLTLICREQVPARPG
jgi:hypothetical protein